MCYVLVVAVLTMMANVALLDVLVTMMLYMRYEDGYI